MPVAVGSYTLAESGPAEYPAGSWSCQAGDLENNTVRIGLGAAVTCTLQSAPFKLHDT